MTRERSAGLWIPLGYDREHHHEHSAQTCESLRADCSWGVISLQEVGSMQNPQRSSRRTSNTSSRISLNPRGKVGKNFRIRSPNRIMQPVAMLHDGWALGSPRCSPLSLRQDLLSSSDAIRKDRLLKERARVEKRTCVTWRVWRPNDGYSGSNYIDRASERW